MNFLHPVGELVDNSDFTMLLHRTDQSTQISFFSVTHTA